MFSGSIVALVTPFRRGKVDPAAIDRLVDWHLDSGTDGIVPCGTTGEAPTLSLEEYRTVVCRVVRRVRGRCPVIAGAGSNDTVHSVELGRIAAKAGADALLVVTPYYNKPNTPGLIGHFRAVGRASGLPIVLYNVPGRTGTFLTMDQFERILDLKGVVAVKEASGSVDLASDLARRRRIPLLSGVDSLNVPLISVGSVGAISVVANIAPRLVKQSIQAALSGDRETALRLHQRLLPLSMALFVEGNPIPLKKAMHLTGLGNGELRLPLAPLSERHLASLKEALAYAGLLSGRRGSA